MIWLLLGMVLFLGMHSARMVAPDARLRFIDLRGMGAWKGLYGVVSLAGLILIIWGYGQARMVTPVLYVPPLWMAHVNLALMWPAFILLIASQFPAGRIKAAVKHPQVLGIKVWAFGHLLANGDVASLILFGGFLGWAVVNRIIWKRRGDPVYTDPSVKWDIIAAIVATVLYVWFVVQGHAWLIGVPVVA